MEKYIIKFICLFIPTRKWRKLLREESKYFFFGREILTKIDSKDNRCIQIIHHHMGEVVTMILTNEYWYKGGPIVVTRTYHKELFHLFLPHIPCVVCRLPKDFSDKKGRFTYNGRMFEFVITWNEMGKLILQREHFFLVWEKFIGKQFQISSWLKPKVDLEIVERVNVKLKKIGIDIDNMVFVAPEAVTIDELPEEFWDKVKRIIKNKGLSMYINTSDIDSETWLTIEEAYYVASKSKVIIGLRSGLIDLLTLLDVPKVIMYTDSQLFGDIQPMYSLSSYPYSNGKLYEFNYKDYTGIDEFASGVIETVEEIL